MVCILGTERGQSKGNKAIGIKEYRAVINGKEYTSPSFSVRTTGVYVSPSLSWEGAGFELNPPTEAGGIIKAGSTVSFTLIYFNLPAHREDCWSQSEYLASIDPENGTHGTCPIHMQHKAACPFPPPPAR